MIAVSMAIILMTRAMEGEPDLWTLLQIGVWGYPPVTLLLIVHMGPDGNASHHNRRRGGGWEVGGRNGVGRGRLSACQRLMQS